MTMSQLLHEVTRVNPSGIAVKRGEDTLTYAELYRRVSALAGAFHRMRVGPGDRIVLLGHPSIEFVISYYATLAIGAIPVSIFPSLAPPEIQHTVDDAAPAAVIFDAANASIAKALRHAHCPIEISCDGTNHQFMSIDQLIALDMPLERWHEPDPDDTVMITYTGGSTGRPKGVMHTSRSISSWLNMDPSFFGVGYAPKHKTILFNMAHLSGQTYLWMIVIMGGCLVLLDQYPARAGDVVDLIERERITGIATVSGMLNGILNLPDIDRRSFESLKIVGVGGSFTSPASLQRAAALFSSAQILVTYSLTESGQIVSALSVNHVLRTKRLERLLSAGMPSSVSRWGQTPLSIRILDETGADVPQGAAGEVVLRGDQLMRGYWNNVEATNEVLKDGWLYTGDVGRLDQEGYLFLLDRKRDMIIASNGVNVYSAEVENVVSQHPSVADAAVVGIHLEDREEVAAVVSLRPGTALGLEELQRWCLDYIGAFKKPTRLLVLDALPRTGAWKANKALLRELLAAAASTPS